MRDNCQLRDVTEAKMRLVRMHSTAHSGFRVRARHWSWGVGMGDNHAIGAMTVGSILQH